MTEHPLTPFLRARWDEEETELREMTGGGLVQGYLRHNGDRLLADIKSKRAILDAWTDRFGNWSADQAEAARAMKAHVMRLLAQPYASHPDYPKDLS